MHTTNNCDCTGESVLRDSCKLRRAGSSSTLSPAWYRDYCVFNGLVEPKGDMGGPVLVEWSEPTIDVQQCKAGVLLDALQLSHQRDAAIGEAHTMTSAKIDRWKQLQVLMAKITRSDTERSNSDCKSATATRRRRGRILLLHQDFWLEALDPKHRYGFNLRAFHVHWKQEMETHSHSCNAEDRSFFFWLDHGQGVTVEMPECGREFLRDTMVEYCSSQQRQQYEVAFTRDGSQSSWIEFSASHQRVHTDNLSKWIFVLAQDGRIYIARKCKGRFHHSSFLAGAPIVAAGKIYVSNGRIHAIEPHSGHFKPRLSNLKSLCRMLEGEGINVGRIHFIKPKKWKDEWPFPTTEVDACDAIPEDTLVSDSDES